MTKGFGLELEKDKDGKFIIRDDTPEKGLCKFYRQKGGSIYYDSAVDNMDKAVLACLEVAKQEKCRVNCDTCSAGLVPITPEMNQTDALNTLTCHMLQKVKPEDERIKKIKQLKAQQIAPESIGFEDFYYLDCMRTGAERIINFCNANDIYIPALKTHYDLAVEYAKSKGGSYEVQVARGTEHFGLPEIINKENLPELRKKLVLSMDDPRVAETKGKIQQYSKEIQNG